MAGASLNFSSVVLASLLGVHPVHVCVKGQPEIWTVLCRFLPLPPLPPAPGPAAFFFYAVLPYFPVVFGDGGSELSFGSSSQQDCEFSMGVLAALHGTRLQDKN